MPMIRRRDRLVNSGTVTFTLVTLTQDVTFTIPFSDNTYKLYWTTPAVNINVSITNKTATGFTMVIAVGLSTSLDWIAIEQLS